MNSFYEIKVLSIDLIINGATLSSNPSQKDITFVP